MGSISIDQVAYIDNYLYLDAFPNTQPLFKKKLLTIIYKQKVENTNNNIIIIIDNNTFNYR